MLIPSTNGRWPAYLLFLLGAIKGIEMIVDWSKTGEIRWFDAGYIATMVLCGFQVLRSLGGLGIHQHGVDLGSIALLWSDIDRWEQPERRAEVHFWTGSPWRFLAVVRPSSPVRFRGMLNAEAARILSERLSPRTDR